MSKLLIKILSICALVVLLPLVVVGASLSVTEAVGCTLTVALGGNEGQAEHTGATPTSSVVIKVDGKVQEGNTIKVAKYSEVTVVYEGTGYDFKGWYEGEFTNDNREEAGFVDKKPAYTFELTHNTNLTAVRDVKTYKITYTGTYDDGTPMDLPNEVREYGEALPTQAAKAHGKWNGWKEVNALGEEVGPVVKFATFDTAEVTLTAKWNDVMVVKFMDGGNEMFSQVVSKYELEHSEYTLPTEANTNVKIPTGYKFAGWKDAESHPVTSLTVDQFDQDGLVLYLDKTLITYNITVYEEGNHELATGTYDVENKFSQSIKGLKKDGYTIKSYSFNGHEYDTLDDLEVDILKSKETTLEVTVKWQYSRVTLQVKLHAKSTQTVSVVYDDVEKTFTTTSLTREGYILKAIEYGGQEYDYVDGTFEGLGAAIMQAGTETVEGATAVWTCEYSSHNFLFKAAYAEEDDELPDTWNAYVNGVLPDLHNFTIVEFVDKEAAAGAEAHDLNDNIYTQFIGSNTVSKEAGGNGTLTYQNKVVVTLGNQYRHEMTLTSEEVTYYTILAFLEEIEPAHFATESDITIAFIFA